MKFVLKPWHLLAGIVAGYANRELQQIIDYLRTENAILRETLGQRRIRLNDAQRRRLAEKGKNLVEDSLPVSPPFALRTLSCAGIASSLPASGITASADTRR